MRPILSDNRLPGWRNRFARARQAGKSLNFASPDSGKGREEENNRASDMPLQADSVFSVSACSLSVFLILLLRLVPYPFPLLFTVCFCVTHFVRDTREFAGSMGTNKTNEMHAFAIDLAKFTASNHWIIKKKLFFSNSVFIFLFSFFFSFFRCGMWKSSKLYIILCILSVADSIAIIFCESIWNF